MTFHTGFPVLDQSYAALRTVVAGVENTALPTPCDQWNVAQVIQHAAGDQIAYAAAIDGGEGPSYDPFSPTGELTGPAVELVNAAIDRAAAAFATIDPAAENVAAPIPPNKMSAQLAAGAAAMDAAVHAWDIAKATGQPSPLTPALAAALMPVATALVEPLRNWGAFKAAVPGTAGEDEIAALLHYLGRRP